MASSHGSDNIERLAPTADYPVLYVDDEAENLLVFRAVFSDEFKVLTAQSAEEALELLAREPVAVLVADQRMPRVSGIELCHMVGERLPQVRRMLLTAYSDHETAIEAINRGGVHAFLEKPWDPVVVRRALWEAVNRVHLDRTVTELRARLLERDMRLEQSRARERLLHDVAGATTRLSLSTHSLQRVLDRSGPQIPQEVRERIAHEVDALTQASEHLGRLQRERTKDRPFGELRPERLRLDELLQTVGVLAAFPPVSRLRLAVHCAPDVVLWADRLSVTRVLVNLLQNARQILEQAGLTVGEVRVDASRQGEMVRIDVADTGPGVPKELRGKIFDEGFTTRHGRGGTGLGLATARELARANGGTLELPDPQPARGALFRVTLPAAQPQQAQHLGGEAMF